MKIKGNSLCRYLNYSKRPSSFIKFQKSSIGPPSLKSNRKLYKCYHSPNKENEVILIKQKFLNNQKHNKFQSSYLGYLAPILSFRKKADIPSNKSIKNNLILTSIDNSSKTKGKEKIFPYEYNNKSKNKIITTNILLKKSVVNNVNKNNISLANFLSNNIKRKSKKKTKNHITPDSKSCNKSNINKINSKVSSDKKNNNKRSKNYFTTSLRTRKNSRGCSDKGKEKEKGRENLMKKLNILDFRKLAKPHSKIVNGECFTFKGSSRQYGFGLTYDSNRKNKNPNFNNNNNANKNKYGVNNFMDYLRGAKFFKYNQKANNSISISSLANISYKKVINNSNLNSLNKFKSPINVSNSSFQTTNNNSKINKNSMMYSIKNISLINNKKNKKVNSKEHKKTKSINIGPISYPCFNCFFNIINDNGNNNNNNNAKSKLNNVTIDMNYGHSKKKIIFFCDKNINHKIKSDINNTINENTSNINNKKGNLYYNNINKKPNKGNNIISNYYININNKIDNQNINNDNFNNNKKINKKENSKLLQNINNIISQSQQNLAQIPRAKKKNQTTKNSPLKVLSQRISTDNNNSNNNNIRKTFEKNKFKNIYKQNRTNKNSKSKKLDSKKHIKEKNEIKTSNDKNKKEKNTSIKKDTENKNQTTKLEDSQLTINLDISHSTKSSVVKDYNYYMKQSNKLSNYIKCYYKKNQTYPPTTINFYKYGRLIGQGAFGKVNIGLNVLSGRVVAIKSFNKDKLTINRENMKKILYETNLMQKLNHPNITKILEMFEDNKFILIIMEYINGGNLFSFVKKRRKLSEKISKFLFRQIILGIKHIHSKDIVHRDIKLENILIDLNNRIKICDFGIGVILNSEDDLLYDQCGTPMYMAPEIILSSKKKGYKGFPVDIWSAGIALYIMLSGTLPFNIKKLNKKNKNSENTSSEEDISLSHNNNYELQYSIINKNPKHIEKISDEARDLLHGLLNKDPNKRLTIDQILNHPWLKSEEKDNDYNFQKNKYKLFTKAEMIMLSKNYIDYRIKGNEDLIENFTLSNLIDSKEEDNYINNNIKTKSSILAPYNTLIENESCRLNEDGELEYDNGELFSDFNNSKINLENDIINMGNKVKQLNINYELNNNGELDNGMIIQSKSKSNTFVNLSLDESKSNSEEKNSNENINYSDFQKKEKLKKEKILNTIEKLGYDKKYVLDCVKNNKLCHASAVFYLLMNYENI